MNWKPRQNNRNYSYQASIDYQTEKIQGKKLASNGTLILNKCNNSTKCSLAFKHRVSPPHVPFGPLVHKDNFLKTLNATSHIKIPWIIDSGASDHMTHAYHLFFSYLPCTGNVKVKIAYGTLSPIGGKKSIKIWVYNSRISSSSTKIIVQFIVYWSVDKTF